jgi:hypothetical protein
VTRKISLSDQDIQEILTHLRACSEVIDKHAGSMSVMELRFKSLLGVLTQSLNEELKLKDPKSD